MSRPVNNRKFVLSALVMIYTLHFNIIFGIKSRQYIIATSKLHKCPRTIQLQFETAATNVNRN